MMIGGFVVRFLENREERRTVIESVEEEVSDSQSYGTDEKNASMEAGNYPHTCEDDGRGRMRSILVVSGRE